jgi:Rieske Fe-S protein
MIEKTTVTRRVAVAGLCGAGCAVALGGCAAYGAGGPVAAPAPAAPAAPAPAGGGAPAPAGKAAAPGLAAAADIPVGGGKIFADQQLVVTQPVKGTFAAFSTVCTHQGCQVNEIADGTINCPCHGSKFAIADGKVAAGPARKPLPSRTVTVADGQIQAG